jgi:hypothetical protein
VAAEGDGGFGAIPSEWKKPFACAACQ